MIFSQGALFLLQNLKRLIDFDILQRVAWSKS